MLLVICLVGAAMLLVAWQFLYCKFKYSKNSKDMVIYDTWAAHEDEVLRQFLKDVEASGKANLTVFKNTVDGNIEVGYGHVVQPSDNLKLGDKITQEKAEGLLTNDIIKHHKLYIPKLKGQEIKTGIARLLVSHAYNTGTASDTLVSMALQGFINEDWHTNHYVTAKGSTAVVPGLVNRRKNELTLV